MNKTIKASEFKAKCLAIMDQVAASGESIIITKNGQPVAQIGPAPKPGASTFIGADKGRIRILGDIISPIDEEWDAEK